MLESLAHHFAASHLLAPALVLSAIGLAAMAACPTGAGSSHSLGQLWAVERCGSCMSDVEMGWTVAPGQYGDAEPHLF